MIIYLTDSYKEDIVDFVKYHEELYDKARKDCLWERVASSCNLSVKVCKTLFESQRDHYEKLIQSKSGQAPKEMIEKQNWIQKIFEDLYYKKGHKQIFRLSVTTLWSQH